MSVYEIPVEPAKVRPEESRLGQRFAIIHGPVLGYCRTGKRAIRLVGPMPISLHYSDRGTLLQLKQRSGYDLGTTADDH